MILVGIGVPSKYVTVPFVTLLDVEWHMITLLFVVSGSLMISKTLRIPKL